MSSYIIFIHQKKIIFSHEFQFEQEKIETYKLLYKNYHANIKHTGNIRYNYSGTKQKNSSNFLHIFPMKIYIKILS